MIAPIVRFSCGFARLIGLSALIASASQSTPVSFRKEIAPLLHRRCATCHHEENTKGRYRLDTFSRLVKPGETDLPPVVPGKPRDSELYLRLIESDPHDRMPQKADPLPAPEIALIERWILEGASYDGGAPERPLAELARESLLRAAPRIYPRPAAITALAFSPSGEQLAVSGYYEVTVWNLGDGSLARRIGGLPERINALAWHPQRDLLAVAGGSPGLWGAIALVDPCSDGEPRYLCDLSDTALSVAFNSDGTELVAGAADRTLRFFHGTTGQPGRIIRAHADWVQSAVFDPQGARVVTASRDRTARIFNVRNGELEATYSGHETPVFGAAFALDGTLVYSFGRGKSLHAWDPGTGRKQGESLVVEGEVQQLQVTPAGLMTAALDDWLRVHQWSDRRELYALRGHADTVQALAISRNGTIASGSADGVVCVWSLACGTWTHRFIASPR